MSMAELVAAGAPELPPGYFYRVKRFMGTGIDVQVRRARRLVGSVELAHCITFPGVHSSGEAAVVAACVQAHQRWAERDEEREACRAAAEFFGDHDPRGGRR